jgi:serine/threonine protein kinase
VRTLSEEAGHAGQQVDLGYRFENVAPVGMTEAAVVGHVVRRDADDLVLGLPVSVVVLGPEADLAEREAFEIDAEALAAVGSHPHVVTLYERLHLANGSELLVLERHHRPGWTAGEVITPREGTAMAIKLAGALEAAHQAGQLHGALEPALVARSLSGEPLLSGFAVPRGNTEPLVLHELSVHTAAELLIGDAPSPSTDVYGLASILYELLSGQAAFRGYDGESDAALGLRILHDVVPPLSSDECPLELVDVLRWSLAAEPRLRPPTAAWLAEELGRIEGSQGWDRTQLPGDATGTAGPPRTKRIRGRHRRL